MQKLGGFLEAPGRVLQEELGRLTVRGGIKTFLKNTFIKDVRDIK